MIDLAQRLPVTRDIKRGDVFTIDSSDVVKIDMIKDKLYLVHTKTDQFYLNLSFDAIEEWLYEDGFRMLDTHNIVNVNQIVSYDSDRGKIMLGTPDTDKDQTLKTATAARIHKQHVMNIMKMLEARSRAPNYCADGEEPLADLMNELTSENENPIFLRSYTAMQIGEERRRANEKINHLAFHDALTNLPNRMLFQDRVRACFEQARTYNRKPAIFFFDLDRFKIINDTLGHHVGDNMLQVLADRLRTLVRPEDTMARFSGDEFIWLIPHVLDRAEAAAFAREVGRLVSKPYDHEGQELFVTASIGVSFYPEDGTDADTLIKHADTAMYRAKEKGGDTFEFYHPDMNFRSLERLHLETHLRKALSRDQIRVHYQPLVDLESGNIFGMEALVRWEHPELGLVSPGEFVPLAEETGVIVPIGNWVLREACMQNKLWHDMGYDLCVSVNISMQQFQHPEFVATIQETLAETGLDPAWLALEITESVAMRNVSFVMETIEELKRIGVFISIDDFGTGYSSLSYLKRFRVHTLKIDRSFIRDVTTDEDNAAIVTALIAMSQQMKMRSLAEGVETTEQLMFLKERGCNEVQGYIYSKPLPAEQFQKLLDKTPMPLG
nr:EAL domain-containing protein [Paenibacillus sp.]